MAVPIHDENEYQDHEPRQEIYQHDHAGQHEDVAQEEAQHPPVVASRNIMAAALAFTVFAGARIMRLLISLLAIGGWIVCHPEGDARCEWPLVAGVVTYIIGRWRSHCHSAYTIGRRTIRLLNERRRQDEPLADGAVGQTIHGRVISHPEGDARRIETFDASAIGYSDGRRIICQRDDGTTHEERFAYNFGHTRGGRILWHPDDDIQHQFLIPSAVPIPLGREPMPPDLIYSRDQRYQNPVLPSSAEKDEEDASSVQEE